MNGNKRQQKQGFSLVEVIVSVLIFTVLILSATQIFKLVIDGQRSAIASQNVQEGIKYFLEVTAKEIRMAERDNGDCPNVPDTDVYATSTNALGDILYFKNYYDQCVAYYLENNSNSQRFKIDRGLNSDYISPKKITIDELNFFIKTSATSQPVVTINLEAHALDSAQFESNMIIQTSVSSRYYRD